MPVTLHFKHAELACRCCGQDGTTPELVNMLEHLRSLISESHGREVPIYIDDAYRCPSWKLRRANVISHTFHTRGLAADIRVPGMSAHDLWSFVRQVPAFTGIGRDDVQARVHIDLRELPARWCYTPAGAVIPWHPTREDREAGQRA
jgi:uncharacterized protein YcbK (DUF882 family)